MSACRTVHSRLARTAGFPCRMRSEAGIFDRSYSLTVPQFEPIVANDPSRKATIDLHVTGLLEGAHTGMGLGHEFLRHCQRSRILVHVIDGTSPDPINDFSAICTELELFNPELADKPQVVAYNKMDVPDSSDYWDDVQEHLLGQGIPRENIVPISAATGQGVIDLVRRLRTVLDSLPPVDESELSTDALNLTEPPRDLDRKRVDDFTISADLARRIFVVEGDAVQRFVQMTNWDYYESLLRFQKVLELSGINKALKKKGVVEGDTVVFGEMELEWSDDQSEGAIYGRWKEERKAQGKPLMGTARWPHAG